MGRVASFFWPGRFSAFLLYFFLLGCSSYGLYSRSIAVNIAQPESCGEKLILVEGTKRGFIHLGGKTVNHPYTRVIPVLKKDPFSSLVLDFDLVQAEIYFFSSFCKVQHFSFQQSLGQGDIQKELAAEPNPNWSTTFALSIKPFLSKYILDATYQLNSVEKTILSNWLRVEENRETVPNF